MSLLRLQWVLKLRNRIIKHIYLWSHAHSDNTNMFHLYILCSLQRDLNGVKKEKQNFTTRKLFLNLLVAILKAEHFCLSNTACSLSTIFPVELLYFVQLLHRFKSEFYNTVNRTREVIFAVTSVSVIFITLPCETVNKTYKT